MDRVVVPYHPLVMLLWGAHMNIQAVTQQAWSLYLLKYAMKSEPNGRMCMSPEELRKIGFSNFSDAQLMVLIAMVTSHTVCLAEAA